MENSVFAENVTFFFLSWEIIELEFRVLDFIFHIRFVIYVINDNNDKTKRKTTTNK